jgi:hypothetical protein
MTTNKRLLELALKGLESERERIDEEIADIRKSLGSPAERSGPAAASAGRPTRGRRLSAAYRRKISEGMKRRWAARKAAASKR